MRRRDILKAVTPAALALSLAAAPAAAQGTYPDQTVRIVVPFTAGSMTDILARAVADKLGPVWHQQVIVENRPGIAGTASVAKAPGDGLVLMLTSNGHTVSKIINPGISFDPIKDFSGVTRVASMPSILVVPPEAPTKTLAALIAEAKAKPGSLNYSSAGLGSATSIAAELLRQTAGIATVHVPYRGMPEAQTSILRGDSAMTFTFYNVGGELIKADKMRALAVTGDARLPQLPDVPTFPEAGLPAYSYDAWFGLMVPATTPRPLVEKIAKDVNAVLADPEMAARFKEQGVNLAPSSPAAFDKVMRDDTERYAKLFEKSGG
jgi:tripartite-type tricarboxylate transporter receptor subunit TctC